MPHIGLEQDTGVNEDPSLLGDRPVNLVTTVLRVNLVIYVLDVQFSYLCISVPMPLPKDMASVPMS